MTPFIKQIMRPKIALGILLIAAVSGLAVIRLATNHHDTAVDQSGREDPAVKEIAVSTDPATEALASFEMPDFNANDNKDALKRAKTWIFHDWEHLPSGQRTLDYDVFFAVLDKLKEAGASQLEIENFIDYCKKLAMYEGKHWEVARWAKLLPYLDSGKYRDGVLFNVFMRSEDSAPNPDDLPQLRKILLTVNSDSQRSRLMQSMIDTYLNKPDYSSLTTAMEIFAELAPNEEYRETYKYQYSIRVLSTAILGSQDAYQELPFSSVKPFFTDEQLVNVVSSYATAMVKNGDVPAIDELLAECPPLYRSGLFWRLECDSEGRPMPTQSGVSSEVMVEILKRYDQLKIEEKEREK